MTDKQLVIDAVSRLPDATPMEAIQEEVDILAAIRRGEESADAGRVVSHDEVKEALNRDCIMRRARSPELRPILLAELEQRYQELP